MSDGKRWMTTKRLSVLLCLVLLLQLCGCALPEDQRFINPTEPVIWEPTMPKPTEELSETLTPTPAPRKTAEQIAAELSRSQKVAQLFLVKCPAGGAAELLKEYDVGGIILYGQDTAGETPSSLRSEIQSYQDLVPVKLIIAVDEEGYPVNRVSNREAFRSKEFPSVRSAYDDNGVQAVREQEGEKSRFLRNLGINVNLGPICDLVTEDDAFMADRSMRLTEIATSEVVAAMVNVMHSNSVGAVLKHFPGYGNSTGDSHTGRVINDNDEAIYWAYDFKPFQAGIEAGVGAVMVSHSLATGLDPTVPASLSEDVIGILREKLKFDGVILCDDITMEAVTDYYEVNEAAVQAIMAGNDMIITTWSEEMYHAVYEAVNLGRITEDELTEHVIRIIQWKMDLGLL